MGRRIRVWQPGIVYSATIRCNDRQFFLKPDHEPESPLLANGCPRNALDVRSRHLPVPSVINIIGAAVARAQQLHPIRLHWVDANINHLTVGFSASDDQLPNISDFFRTVASIIARQLNKKWNHEGHIWSSPFRTGTCGDDQGAEQQLIYCVTNPVKDGLVATVRESPFFNSYRSLARGEPLRFWRIDWNAFYLAGGFRKKNHQPKDYLEWLDVDLAPLPHQADWPPRKRQAWLRNEVCDFERETAVAFCSSGRKPMGAAAQYKVDPRDRPANPKSSGPQPLCHASSREVRLEYAKEWREILRAHREASIDYRMGYWEREFPEGTFRPPLTSPYGSKLRL
jgi:hypothetical protein